MSHPGLSICEKETLQWWETQRECEDGEIGVITSTNHGMPRIANGHQKLEEARKDCPIELLWAV